MKIKDLIYKLKTFEQNTEIYISDNKYEYTIKNITGKDKVVIILEKETAIKNGKVYSDGEIIGEQG